MKKASDGHAGKPRQTYYLFRSGTDTSTRSPGSVPKSRILPIPYALAVAGIIMGVATAGCATVEDHPALTVRPAYQVSHGVVRRGEPVADQAYARGKYYFYQDRFVQARDAFAEAVRLNPNNVDALNGLGAALDRLADYPRARQAYAAALRLDPKAAHVLANLGYSLMLAGRDAEAVDPLQRALELDANNALAKANLARALEATQVAASAGAALRPTVASTIAQAAGQAPAGSASAPSDAGAAPIIVMGAPASSPSAPPISGPSSATASGGITVMPAPEQPAVRKADVVDTVTAQPSPATVNTLTEQVVARKSDVQEIVSSPAVTATAVSAPEKTVMHETNPNPPAQSSPTVQVSQASGHTFPPSPLPAPSPAPQAMPQSQRELSAASVTAIGQTGASTSGPGPILAKLRIEISNGNGVRGMARAMGTELKRDGVNVTRVTNAKPFNRQRTVIYADTNTMDSARALGKMLPVPPKVVVASVKHRKVDVRVVIGTDLVLASSPKPTILAAVK